MLVIEITREGRAKDGPHNDYYYSVYVNDERIAVGDVKGHNRDDGWVKLLALLAEQAEAEHE